MRILLFSGGIDSTCLAWLERPDRLAFIDYGQIPAKGELRACKSIAGAIGVPLDVHETNLRSFGSGLMAGSATEGGPPEFWPFRNQMLVTLAAMYYAPRGGNEILIGTVFSDRQHPDGRHAFRRAMGSVLKSQGSITLRAPAANEQTVALARRSMVPHSVLGWTFSCHTGEWACGQCGGCRKHADVKIQIGF